MINKLDNTNDRIAKAIFTTFQRAYTIEAQLIDVLDFPPLSRTVNDIKNDCLDICSLTVDPDYFRKGIAHKLLESVLAITPVSRAIVETAVANTPAINLYKKHGFMEYKRWTPSHGIEKIAMSIRAC
ncbi:MULTISPECIES: GNAT family N-acetyltransferase [unclassified Pseudoalteromonas]|uniref:GNAT family N-acetyltransferase n=1 Tax=unclassified Pseudoalteromonas TaxID=194690 RepID=UPI00386EB8C8